MVVGCFVVWSLLLTAVIIETGTLQKINKNKRAVVLLICIITNTACTNKGAQPIKLNVDNCDYCKMTISDGKMAAEVITKKVEYINLTILFVCMDMLQKIKIQNMPTSILLIIFHPPILLILKRHLC